MKVYLASLALLLLSTFVGAVNDAVADTTLYHNGRKYVIVDEKDPIDISVYTSHGDVTEQVYEAKFDKGEKVSSRWEIKDIISVPFVNEEFLMTSKKRKRSFFKFEPHWAGIAFGFGTAANAGWSVAPDYSPTGLSIDMGRSFEISWNIFDMGFPIIWKNFGLVSGLGLNWRNYVLDGYKRFDKINPYEIGITAVESGVVDYSRMKVVDLTIPILLEWQTKSRKNQFFVTAGVHVNFRTHSSIKSLYQKNGYQQKDFIHGIGSNPVNVDLVGKIGYEHFSVYAKQALTPMFAKGKGPEMYPLSVGFMLNF